MRTKLAIALVALGAGACDPGYLSPEVRAECTVSEDGSSRGCAGDQLCLAGRCFAPCAGDRDCSRWERCVEGACLSSATPQEDGGSEPDGDSDADADTDADADADADTNADADTVPDECASCPDRCHELARVCVDCVESSQCTVSPVCNVALGLCTDVSPGQCAPCDPATTESCAGDQVCVDRRPGHFEVVCLTPCAALGGCPQGTACEEERCVPATGVSCTAWYSASRGRSCAVGADCLALGAEATGVECSAGETCTIACGGDGDCPAGRSCDPTTLLCQ